MTTIPGTTGTGVSHHTGSTDTGGTTRSGVLPGAGGTAHCTGASMILSGMILSGALHGAGDMAHTGVIRSSTQAFTGTAHGTMILSCSDLITGTETIGIQIDIHAGMTTIMAVDTPPAPAARLSWLLIQELVSDVWSIPAEQLPAALRPNLLLQRASSLRHARRALPPELQRHQLSAVGQESAGAALQESLLRLPL